MKAARFVMRSASSLNSAGLVPREVELFSRYSPSPLSMKQLLDFGERRYRAQGGGVEAGEAPGWEGLSTGLRQLRSIWLKNSGVSKGCVPAFLVCLLSDSLYQKSRSPVIILILNFDSTFLFSLSRSLS